MYTHHHREPPPEGNTPACEVYHTVPRRFNQRGHRLVGSVGQLMSGAAGKFQNAFTRQNRVRSKDEAAVAAASRNGHRGCWVDGGVRLGWRLEVG